MAAALRQYQACMGIMVLLRVEDLNDIKYDFDAAAQGLSLEEFVSVMLDRVTWKQENVINFIKDLIELFAQVDVNGDGTMTWEEFTSAIIEGGMGSATEDMDWRDMKYDENHHFSDPNPKPSKRIMLLPEFRKMLLFEGHRPVLQILDATALLGGATSDILPSSESGTNGANGPGSSSNDVAGSSTSNSANGGSSAMSVSASITNLPLIGRFHPLTYVNGYRKDQDEFRSERSPVQAVKYLHTLDMIAVSAGDLKLSFWSATVLNNTENLFPLTMVHTPRPQRVLEWHAEASYLFTISADLLISVYKVTRDRSEGSKRCEVNLVTTLKKHTDLLQDLLVLNSETLLSCGMDSLIYVWDPNTLQVRTTRHGHRRGVRLMAKLTNVLFLSSGFEGEILGWDVSGIALTPVFRLWGHTAPVCSIQIIPAGSVIDEGTNHASTTLTDQAVTVDDDGWFKWWNLANILSMEEIERCIQTFRLGSEKYPWKAHSMVALNGGNSLVAAGYKLKLIQRVRLKPKVIASSVVLYNDVLFTLLTTTDKEIRIWDASTGALLRTFRNISTSDITCVELDTRQRKIVFGNQNGEIIVLNHLNGAVIKTFASHQLSVSALIYCREDKCVLTASWDRSIRLYDDDSSNPLLRCITEAHDTDIKCLAYCYSMGLVASGSSDGTIKIWDYVYFLLEDECHSPNSIGGGGAAAAGGGSGGDVCQLCFMEPYPLLVSGHENAIVCLWGLYPGQSQSCVLLVVVDCVQHSRSLSLAGLGSRGLLHHHRSLCGGPAEDTKDEEDDVAGGDQSELSISSLCGFYDETGGDLLTDEITRGRHFVIAGDTAGFMFVLDISRVIAAARMHAVKEENLPCNNRSYNPRRRFLRNGKHAKRLNKGKRKALFDATTSGNGLFGGDMDEARREVDGDGEEEDGPQSTLEAPSQSLVATSPVALTSTNEEQDVVNASHVVLHVSWKAHRGMVRNARVVEEPRSILTCSSDKSVRIWDFEGKQLGYLNNTPASNSTANDPGSTGAGGPSVWKWKVDVVSDEQEKTLKAQRIWDKMKKDKLARQVKQLAVVRRTQTIRRLDSQRESLRHLHQSESTKQMSPSSLNVSFDGAFEQQQQQQQPPDRDPNTPPPEPNQCETPAIEPNELPSLREQRNENSTVEESTDSTKQHEISKTKQLLFDQMRGISTWKKSDVQLAREIAWSKESKRFEERMQRYDMNKRKQPPRKRRGLYGQETEDPDSSNQEEERQEVIEGMGGVSNMLAISTRITLPSLEQHPALQELPFDDKDNWSVGSLNRRQQMYGNFHQEKLKKDQVKSISSSNGTSAGSSSMLVRGSASTGNLRKSASRELLREVDLKPSAFLLEKLGVDCLINEDRGVAHLKRKRQSRNRLKHMHRIREEDEPRDLPRSQSVQQVTQVESETERQAMTRSMIKDLTLRYYDLMNSVDPEDDLKAAMEHLNNENSSDKDKKSDGLTSVADTDHEDEAKAVHVRVTKNNSKVRKVQDAAGRIGVKRRGVVSKGSSTKSSKHSKPTVFDEAVQIKEKKHRIRTDAMLLKQPRFGSYTREDVLTMYRAFWRMDKDDSGHVELKELATASEFCSSSYMQSNILGIFQSLDKDASGTIDFPEFCRAVFPDAAPSTMSDIVRFCGLVRDMNKARLQEKKVLAQQAIQEITDLFHLYDRDHSGSIDTDELMAALSYNAKFYDKNKLGGSQSQVDEDDDDGNDDNRLRSDASGNNGSGNGGMSLTREDLVQIMEKFDHDTSKSLDLAEFIELFREVL